MQYGSGRKEQEDKLRWRKLPTEPRMGQVSYLLTSEAESQSWWRCQIEDENIDKEVCCGLPRLRAPGIVPCIISFSRQLPYYLPNSYSIWHGTDNKIVLHLCVRACVCVCVSVCGHSYGRISSSIFTKLDVHESPKFLYPIGNRGRGTRWWRQMFDRK